MGWLAAVVAMVLLVLLVRKSVDRETARSLRLLLTILVAVFAMLVVAGVVATS